TALENNRQPVIGVQDIFFCYSDIILCIHFVLSIETALPFLAAPQGMIGSLRCSLSAILPCISMYSSLSLEAPASLFSPAGEPIPF
ncbi:MAG: hypothetical protein LKK27_08485, partial [Eubacterium sp.]|nr:hypothetical protein [Eubacterium sp.]